MNKKEVNKKEMTTTELLLRSEELRRKAHAINDKVEAEQRSALSDDEQREWNAIDKEQDEISRELKLRKMAEIQDSQFAIPATYAYSRERAEAGKMLRDALSKKGEIRIELRDAPTTSATVQGAVPIYVKDFIEPLEKGVIYDKLGINIEYGLTGTAKYPIMPYITATIEDEAVRLEDTTINTEAITPKPHRVAIKCPLTGLANIITDMKVYNWVVTNVARAVARTVNRWMFQPSAIKANIFGCFAYDASFNKIQEKAFKGAVPTYQELLAMRGAVMATGAYPDGTYAYVMSANMYTTLEATPKASGSAEMIINNGQLGGYPVFITEEIESLGDGTYNAAPKHVGFGRFSDCKVGQFGNMNLLIDPYTDGDKDIVSVLLNTHWAVDLIRPKSFVIGTVAA